MEVPLLMMFAALHGIFFAMPACAIDMAQHHKNVATMASVAQSKAHKESRHDRLYLSVDDYGDRGDKSAIGKDVSSARKVVISQLQEPDMRFTLCGQQR